MPTLLLAYSATSKRLLTSSPRLDNEANLIATHGQKVHLLMIVGGLD
jgi:hypothetical protein